ncbi:universal stress protein [Streptomyces sp. SID13031]|uniref:universal stress protein n=1 Tax=Streptomyces sp. SID13031 TaxID=2706046 RepID=UPI0013C86BAF|nr:universal stress protein [Streptomyces sp. SID13031]NEA37600.1 universal stress protein [Streptomyces sp. SID13031]
MSLKKLDPIVVGYDGSPGSRAALRWAVAEAVRQLSPLRLVEVFEPGPVGYPSADQVPLAGLRKVQERALDTLTDSIRLQHPQLAVDSVLVDGFAASSLIDESAHARLSVLGTRGHGGWTGILLGSVANQVSMHSAGPVVVVPAASRPRVQDKPTIVVGVDGSKASTKAIDFAFAQAEDRGARVVAVIVTPHPAPIFTGGLGLVIFDPADAANEDRILVSESLAGAGTDYPDVESEIRLMTGHPAQALVLAAENAELLVVGSRGRAGFASLLLGSVSLSVLHHAQCPVAIVR